MKLSLSTGRWKPTVCTALLCAGVLPLAAADLGRLSWGAMNPQNDTAGRTLYGGDGTFYGQQADQDADGACSYGSNKSDTLGLPWTTGIKNTIALNSNQFQQGLACGTCVYYRGTGGGLGTTPIPSTWQRGFVSNLCPECAFGSIDLNLDGNGRWNVEWFPVPCNVGNSSFTYVNSGDTGNPYWFQFTVSNTRVPVKKVEMMIDETWGEMRRTFNNMYAANGGPFNTWPLPLRITSMLNDTVLDMLPSAAGGNGTAQFPDHGPAIYPEEGITAETADGFRAAAIPALANAIAPTLAPSEHAAALAPRPIPSSPVASFPAHSKPTAATLLPSTPAYSTPAGLTPAAAPVQAIALAPVPATSQQLPITVLGSNIVAPSLTMVAYTVPDHGQCGGAGMYCSDLIPKQCKDAIWQQSSCNPGFSCQRSNVSWWSCESKADTAVLPLTSTPQLNTTNLTARSQAPAASSSKILRGSQCGGSAGPTCNGTDSSPCKDGQWPGSNCEDGLICQRSNASRWQCEVAVTAFSGEPSVHASGAQSTLPAPSPTPLPVPATPQPPAPNITSAATSSITSLMLGKDTFSVVAGGQCGGTTSYCAYLSGFQCRDAVWDGAQCPDSYTCTRWNSGWWQCSSSSAQSVSTVGRKLLHDAHFV